jgi:hypothetical protein
VPGNKVVPVLSTPIASRTDDGNSSTADIVVLKTRTDGFFDWKKRGERSVILKWNGAGYDLHGADVVEDLNALP